MLCHRDREGRVQLRRLRARPARLHIDRRHHRGSRAGHSQNDRTAYPRAARGWAAVAAAFERGGVCGYCWSQRERQSTNRLGFRERNRRNWPHEGETK